MAALNFQEYLRLKATKVEQPQHDPEREYANFKSTFEAWVAKGGQMKQNIAKAAFLKDSPLTPVISLLEFSVPLNAPATTPSPSLDEFLAYYPASERGIPESQFQSKDSDIASSDAFASAPSTRLQIPKYTILSGILKSSTPRGWDIEILHIFDRNLNIQNLGLPLPIHAICPSSRVTDYSRSIIKRTFQPGSFVKVGVLRSGPEVQQFYNSEISLEVTMCQKDIPASLKDRHHELGWIEESFVYHDYSLSDPYFDHDFGGYALGCGILAEEGGRSEPFQPRNAVYLISQHHHFGIHDYLSLREDLLAPSQNMNREWYADRLRVKQEKMWAEDLAAHGYRSFAKSDFSKATELFDQALDLDSHCTNAMLGKAMVLGVNHDFDPAMRYLNQVLRDTISPQDLLTDLKREARDAIKVLQKLHRKWNDYYEGSRRDHRTSDTRRNDYGRYEDDYRGDQRRQSTSDSRRREFPIEDQFRHLLQYKFPDTPTKSVIDELQSPNGDHRSRSVDRMEKRSRDDSTRSASPSRPDRHYDQYRSPHRHSEYDSKYQRGNSRDASHRSRDYRDSHDSRYYDRDDRRYEHDRYDERRRDRHGSQYGAKQSDSGSRSSNDNRRSHDSHEHPQQRVDDLYDRSDRESDRRPNDHHQLSSGRSHYHSDARKYRGREDRSTHGGAYSSGERSYMDRSYESTQFSHSRPSSASGSSHVTPNQSSRQPLSQKPQQHGSIRPISSNLTLKNRSALSTFNSDFSSSRPAVGDPHLDSMILDDASALSDAIPPRSNKKRYHDEMS